MAQDYSFEEINRQINALNLEDFQPGGQHYFTGADVAAAPGDVLKKLCRIYRPIRPILDALRKFPLIPKKWRDAIGVFMDLMDKLCSIE